MVENENEKKRKMKYMVILDGGEGGEGYIYAYNDTDAIDKAISWASGGNWWSDPVMHTSVEVFIKVIHIKTMKVIFADYVQIDPPLPECTSPHGHHNWKTPEPRSRWIDQECKNCHIVKRKYYDSDEISYIFPYSEDDKE